MARSALFLSLIAAVAAVYAAFEAKDAVDRLEQVAQAQERAQAELSQLTARVDGLCEGEGGVMLPFHAGGAEDAPGSTGTTTGATLATRAPVSVGERLAVLQKKFDDQQATLSRLEEQAKAREGVQSHMAALGRDDFFFNADQAATALGLDGRQKADMQDILDRSKRDLEDVFRLPNDDGETWDEIRKPKTQKIGGDEGGITLSMPDMGKIQKFKKSRIPGSNETYEAAEKRIKDSAFTQIRNFLNPKQQDHWDRAQKDPLLNNNGSGSGMMFTTLRAESVNIVEGK